MEDIKDDVMNLSKDALVDLYDSGLIIDVYSEFNYKNPNFNGISIPREGIIFTILGEKVIGGYNKSFEWDKVEDRILTFYDLLSDYDLNVIACTATRRNTLGDLPDTFFLKMNMCLPKHRLKTCVDCVNVEGLSKKVRKLLITNITFLIKKKK